LLGQKELSWSIGRDELKRIFEWLGFAILVAVILALVGIIVAPSFGWDVAAIYGGSMEPTIKLGSMAVVRPVDPQDIRWGDIISYTSPHDARTTTTHRVVGVVESEDSLMFNTKGDANEDPDNYAVPAEDINGRVWFSVPYAGYAVDYMKTPLGFGLLIGIPAALIIGIESRNIFLATRDLQRKGNRRKALKGNQKQVTK